MSDARVGLLFLHVSGEAVNGFIEKDVSSMAAAALDMNCVPNFVWAARTVRVGLHLPQ